MANLIAAVLFTGLVACTPDTSIRPDGTTTNVRTVDCSAVTPTATVMTFGLAFDPTPTKIGVGGVVKFVMPAQHNVFSATPGLAVDFGATRCVEFPAAGTFTFVCARHGFMGTVTVDGVQGDAGVPIGPGGALHCQSSATGANAFETYGAAAFVAVNEEIFALVTAEYTANGTSNLGDSFTKVGTGVPPSTSDNIDMFKGRLAAFLVYAYGGPAQITYTDGITYEGPQDMVAAHEGLNITSSQFDYFVSNIVVPALLNKGVTPDDVSSCFAPVITSAAFKASIVGQ